MVLLLSIHLVLSTLYLFIWLRKSKGEAACRFIVVLFLPIVGFFFFGALWVIDRFWRSQEAIDSQGLISNSKRSKFITEPDYVQEVNLVSLEEVLTINGNGVKRKALIDTLKRDADRYIEFLKMALDDSDTETVHYAAAAIVEIKRKFDLSLQEMDVSYEKDRINTQIASAYAEILTNYLRSGLLDKDSERKYRYMQSNVLENIVFNQSDEPKDESHFTELVDSLLVLKEYDKARKICDLFLRSFPASENAYITTLKFHYELREKENFETIFKGLKQVPLTFSVETLQKVRFWSAGGVG